MKPSPTMKIAGLIVTAMLLASLTSAARTAYADALLTGAVTSASGEKMGGVTVSAKAEKSPITTSVFTDESGNYYFPPLPNGKYKVWAQALTFHRANGEVALQQKNARRNFRAAADEKPGRLDSPVAR